MVSESHCNKAKDFTKAGASGRFPFSSPRFARYRSTNYSNMSDTHVRRGRNGPRWTVTVQSSCT